MLLELHLIRRHAREEKAADPTASPLKEGLLSTVLRLGATGGLQKD